MLNTILIAFRRTSMSALFDTLKRRGFIRDQTCLERICSTSMISPSNMAPCFERSVSSLSRTMSFTLLSDSLMTRFTKQDAAASDMQTLTSIHNCGRTMSVPLMAAGFCVSVVSVVAASYFTACDDELSSSNMQRIYRGYSRSAGNNDQIRIHDLLYAWYRRCNPSEQPR